MCNCDDYCDVNSDDYDAEKCDMCSVINDGIIDAGPNPWFRPRIPWPWPPEQRKPWPFPWPPGVNPWPPGPNPYMKNKITAELFHEAMLKDLDSSSTTLTNIKNSGVYLDVLKKHFELHSNLAKEFEAKISSLIEKAGD